jgi:hypothetical protein
LRAGDAPQKNLGQIHGPLQKIRELPQRTAGQLELLTPADRFAHQADDVRRC